VLSEALKELRSGMLAAFLATALWALALPSIVDELRDRASAEHLVTWLLLRETFAEFAGLPSGVQEFNERFVPSDPKGRVIDSEMKEPPPETADLRPGGDNLPSSQPLQVTPLWPEERVTLDLKLVPRDTPIDKYQIYLVRSDARLLPFDKYAIVLDTTSSCRQCVTVLGSAPWPRGAREVDFDVQRRRQPLDWDERRARLWTTAAPLTDPMKLHLSDPSVIQYFKAILGTHHTIWGMPLDPGLFFAIPGILLGVQAVVLLGAMMVLKRDINPPPDQLWILALSTRLPLRRLLEGLLVAASLCWVALPLAILAAQLVAGVQLHPLERLCLWLGAAGLAGATVFNAAAVFHLRRLRRFGVGGPS
jgi:hypothetical protein